MTNPNKTGKVMELKGTVSALRMLNLTKKTKNLQHNRAKPILYFVK